MDFNYFLLESTDFFKDAEQYFLLRKRFGGLFVWIDMIVAPLITIITFLLHGTYDMFALLTFGKSFMVVREWLRYRELSSRISKWKHIVKNAGGPFISTNDPEYHIYVYADGMQRLHNSMFKKKCQVLPRNH
jgi:hypothetical protein